MQSSPKKQKFITRGLPALVIIALGIFVTSRILPVFRGAQITLVQIPETMELTSPTIELSGKVTDTKKITLNGTPVFISPQGTFTQKLLLSPGYNSITFDAVDILGKTKKQTHTFVLKELATGSFAVSSLPIQN